MVIGRVSTLLQIKKERNMNVLGLKHNRRGIVPHTYSL